MKFILLIICSLALNFSLYSGVHATFKECGSQTISEGGTTTIYKYFKSYDPTIPSEVRFFNSATHSKPFRTIKIQYTHHLKNSEALAAAIRLRNTDVESLRFDVPQSLSAQFNNGAIFRMNFTETNLKNFTSLVSAAHKTNLHLAPQHYTLYYHEKQNLIISRPLVLNTAGKIVEDSKVGIVTELEDQTTDPSNPVFGVLGHIKIKSYENIPVKSLIDTAEEIRPHDIVKVSKIKYGHNFSYELVNSEGLTVSINGDSTIDLKKSIELYNQYQPLEQSSTNGLTEYGNPEEYAVTYSNTKIKIITSSKNNSIKIEYDFLTHVGAMADIRLFYIDNKVQWLEITNVKKRNAGAGYKTSNTILDILRFSRQDMNYLNRISLIEIANKQ